MKRKQLKEYLGEVINYTTICRTTGTGKLIKLTKEWATFEMNDIKTDIQPFNIIQVELLNK